MPARDPSNRLLAALHPETRARMAPDLQLETLSLGQVLCEPGVRPRDAYFPVDCVVSLVHFMQSGASAEISMTGNDGMVGIGLVTGGGGTPGRAIVQCAGSAYRVSGESLRAELGRNGDLLAVLLRYAQALLTQTAQTAACNRYHSIEQQLCRWLLLSLDRVPGNRLPITHGLIAGMLGVRREGVTEAAGKLQHDGVIQYIRGQITVLNRGRLERLSCECYEAIRRETERLLTTPSH